MFKIIQVFFIIIAAFVFLGIAMYVSRVIATYIDKKRGIYSNITIHDSELRSDENGKKTN